MAWFKVDDKFPTSPKVMRIPRSVRLAAIGLWTTAGAWSAEHEQDGQVPAYMIDEWGDDGTLAGHLVNVGLWREIDDGFVFHDWADYQPTRAENDARREAERRRKEDWRRKKAEKSGQSPQNVPAGQPRDTDGTDGTVPSIPTRPDPTRPEAKASSPPKAASGRKKPALPLPSDWEPSDEHRAFVAKHHLDLDFEVHQFRAHAEANDRRQVSWNGAFSTWLGKSSQRPRPAGSGWPSPPPRQRSPEQLAAWLAQHGVSLDEWHALCGEHGEREARQIVEGRGAA